jgi:hypothetical protein
VRPASRPAGGQSAAAPERGGYSTKIHLRRESAGEPVVLVLTEGQRHEQPVLSIQMERGAVKRPGRGRPRIRPDRVAGDKRYSDFGQW